MSAVGPSVRIISSCSLSLSLGVALEAVVSVLLRGRSVCRAETSAMLMRWGLSGAVGVIWGVGAVVAAAAAAAAATGEAERFWSLAGGDVTGTSSEKPVTEVAVVMEESRAVAATEALAEEKESVGGLGGTSSDSRRVVRALSAGAEAATGDISGAAGVTGAEEAIVGRAGIGGASSWLSRLERSGAKVEKRARLGNLGKLEKRRWASSWLPADPAESTESWGRCWATGAVW